MTRDAWRICPVCAGAKVEFLHHQKFALPDGYPLVSSYDVVCCVNCGFVYADTSSTQADYDAFYTGWSIYDDPATAAGGGETAADRQRLDKTISILTQWLPSREIRILDIGCATGGLLAALRNAGYRNLLGIDPSPLCVARTREKIGEAHQASIMNLPDEIGPCDCVLLSHVLEHVRDVALAVANLPRVLREGGLAYVELPDAMRYTDYIYAPFQDFNTEHINHFSRPCLDNAMALQGFEPLGGDIRVQPSSSNTFAPAFYAVYRLTGKGAPFARDTQLKTKVLDYIERSSALLASIDTCIREALETSPELIVWGTGQLALKLLAESSLKGAKVMAFADSNPVNQGRRLCGLPIIAPADIRGHSEPILIATLLHQNAILADIQKLGLTNRSIVLPEGGPKFFEAA
jgi:ubiquinone/menaquinone biosynthesis C-methylase UbiE